MFNKKEYMKQWRDEHKKQIKENRRLYYKKNCEKAKLYSKQYVEDNPEKVKKQRKLYAKQYYKDNREQIKQYQEVNNGKMKEYRKKHYQENREENRGRIKQYRINNPEKARESQRKYCAKKYKINLKFKLNSRMANTIKKALKGNKNGRRWESLVGCTLNDLIKHLMKTMPDGYTWRDYLDGKLHIDHIIPIKVFNFTKPEHIDFKRCWDLSNLKLLPAKENLIKNDKLTRPFQPALQFDVKELRV